jgi:hypothetical protein
MATSADRRRAKMEEVNALDQEMKASELGALAMRKQRKINANNALAEREAKNAAAYK